MGIHTRVGLAAGTIGFALLYLAQPLAGAAAVVLAPLVGLLAGLGTAKWLPRDWYGRQLEAGARAGVLACAVALAGFLISLIVAGAHTTGMLAARSHLVGIDLGAAVRVLGVAGWLGAGVALALAALVAGTGVAALASQLGAWDKNRHAIEVVKRAREAAQRSGRLTAAPRTRPALPNLPQELDGYPDTVRQTPIPSPLSPSSLPSSPPSWPSLPGSPPPDGDLSGDDLAGLNESWHSLRSPLSVFPAPDAPEKPWTRHDERLPPGALLPDELALDPEDDTADGMAADAAAMTPTSGPTASAANGSGPATWDGTAWRDDAGWMDYEDSARAAAEPAGPAQQPASLPEAGEQDEAGKIEEDEEGEKDEEDEEDSAEADSWLN